MTEETIFAAAMELQPSERAAYLAQACGQNSAMRKRLEDLLSADDRAEAFMARPAVAVPEMGESNTEIFQEDSTPNEAKIKEAAEVELGFLSPRQIPDSLGRLGHYEVLQILGKGGFGIVFRVLDVMLQRVVALKVLAPELAATSPARRRFLREARSSAQVRHENVVQVYEVGEQPLPYLAMEFIPGETLQQKLDRIGPLDVAETLRIGRQIAAGLAAAHDHDLIHRDIKPGNILLESGPHGHAKITDFGLARAADDASISQSGIIAGTPLFMAPEQAQGQPLDQRADLFSLGSVLYTMLAGRPPFRANNSIAVLKRVTEDQPRAIREIIPETPQWLCDIIAKLHAKNPDDRYQTAREVADVLADCEAQFKADSKLNDFSRIPQSKRAAGRSGRRKWIAAAVLLLPAIALAVTEFAGVTHLFPEQQATNSNKAGGDPTPVVDAKKETPIPGAKSAPLPAVVPFTAAEAKARQEEWARHLGMKDVEFADTKLGMEFRVIPPGEFQMGARDDEVKGEMGSLQAETPRHPVRITRPFAIGKFEVTVGQFRKFIDANPTYKTTAERDGGYGIKNGEVVSGKEYNWKNVGYEQADRAPVWSVSWDDAVEFCKWLSKEDGRKFRLPTEAEWEWACRAGTDTRTFWPASDNSHQYAYSGSPNNRKPQTVGGLSANAYGLHDACGNVWEWCHDWFNDSYYKNSPVDDPTGPPGPQEQPRRARHRVQRGGGTYGGAFALNSTSRLLREAEVCGFRVVCDLAEDSRPTPTPVSKQKPVEVVLPAPNVHDTWIKATALLPLDQHAAALLAKLKERLPGFEDAMLRTIPSMAGDRQAIMVAAWLRELNPAFQGEVTHQIEGGVLTNLEVTSPLVRDLTPLKALPELKSFTGRGTLGYDNQSTRDAALLRSLKALETINGKPVAQFWTDAEARQAEFKEWLQLVPTLTAEQQVAAVVARLKERNPGLEGTARHKIEGGVVTELIFTPVKGQDMVTDIAPVRALPGLTWLNLWGCVGLEDLEPLKDLKLTRLIISSLTVNNQVRDLKPLRGMKLTELRLYHCQVQDLEPLTGMPLNTLWLYSSQVRDIEPLKGMPLTSLALDTCTPIKDFTPLKGMALSLLALGRCQFRDIELLKGMPLTALTLADTQVHDLAPLKGMPLKRLSLYRTAVTDLKPLQGMDLEEFYLTPKNITQGLESLRDMKSLNKIGIDYNQAWPAAEFWERYDKGEFTK
jgi:eukaryotic-like serine/threonine-protein kinase